LASWPEIRAWRALPRIVGLPNSKAAVEVGGQGIERVVRLLRVDVGDEDHREVALRLYPDAGEVLPILAEVVQQRRRGPVDDDFPHAQPVTAD